MQYFPLRQLCRFSSSKQDNQKLVFVQTAVRNSTHSRTGARAHKVKQKGEFETARLKLVMYYNITFNIL